MLLSPQNMLYYDDPRTFYEAGVDPGPSSLNPGWVSSLKLRRERSVSAVDLQKLPAGRGDARWPSAAPRRWKSGRRAGRDSLRLRGRGSARLSAYLLGLNVALGNGVRCWK